MTPIRLLAIVALALATAFGLRSALTPDPAPVFGLAQPGTGPDLEVDRLISVFERRLEDRTDYPDLLTLGNLYLERGRATGELTDLGAARRTLTDAVERVPDDPDAQLSLAAADLAVHNFDGAIAGAESVLQLEPGRLAAVALLGDAHLALGNLADARLAYDRLVDPAFIDPAVLLRHAELAWSTGDVDTALGQAGQAMDVATDLGLPDSTTAIYIASYADYLFHLGRYETVIDLVAPLDGVAGATHVHAEALAALGRLDEAIRLLEPNAAGDVELMILLEELYLAAGRPTEAAALPAAIEAAAGEDPYGAFDRTIARWLANRNRDIDRAVDLALRDARVDPGADDVRAWVLFRAGRFDEARHFADRALESSLPDPLIAFHSAMIWEALGDTTRAIDDAQQALDASPEFSPTFARIAREIVGRERP